MEKTEPLNLRPLIPDERTKPTTKPVTSTAVFVSSTKSFHPEGLFSNEIFGIQGTPERYTTFAHIKLKAPVIHPRIYRGLVRGVRLYEAIMQGKAYAIWDDKTKNFIKSDIENGDTGYGFFIKHINKLVLADSGTLSRETLIKLLKMNPQRTISYITVMPAGVRDYIVDKEGKPSKDEINDFYVSILSITNVLDENPGKEYDVTRYNLQQRINELTTYILDGTAYGFINKRWLNRRIFGGTKNVMTGYQQPSVDLDSPSKAASIHTHIGLYQAVKSSPEHVVYAIQQGFLKDILVENDGLYVIDKRTLKQRRLPFDQEFYDLIYSSDGVLKLMTSLKYDKARSTPLEYHKHWLGILYENYDEGELMILRDIDDLPKGKDKDYVRPITLADIFVISAYHKLHNRGNTANRHPIMDNGGIYVGLNYLKVTTRVVSMTLLDHDGNKTDTVYASYPDYRTRWFTSSSPNPARLGPLAGDHDGDMLGNIALNTKDANDEIKQKLKQARNYISADGSLHYSLTGGVLPLILSTIMSR